MAKKILHHDTGLRSPQLMHPAREWGIGLFIGVVIFAVSAFWSAQIYLSHREISIGDGGGTNSEVTVYRKTLVDAALAELEKRSAAHTELLPASSGIVVEEAVEEEGDAEDEILETDEETTASSTATSETDSSIEEEDGEAEAPVNAEEAPVSEYRPVL